MVSKTLLVGVTACLIVSLAAADCPGLSVNVVNSDNSSELTIEGTYTDESYEGGKMVVVLSVVPSSIESSAGIDEVSMMQNQISGMMTGTGENTFSMTIEKPDNAEASVLMMSAGNSLCDITSLAAGSAKWTWDGKKGPAFWESLGYPDCGPGNEFQSPFNIETSSATDGNIVEEMTHSLADFVVSQNHGVPVFSCAEPGSCGKIRAGEVDYDLVQFHFHSYSEYSLDGAFGVLGVHFVHVSANSKLLVLGRIYHTSNITNPGFEKFWNSRTVGSEAEDDVSVSLNIDDDMYADAIETGNSLYMFAGSLTTPPCSGGVQWLFLGTPGTISMEQANIYRSHAAETNQRGENRPLQPVNGRAITVRTF